MTRNQHLTQREIAVTGRRYCTTCHQQQPPDGGEKRRFRWICKHCAARTSQRLPSPYVNANVTKEST